MLSGVTDELEGAHELNAALAPDRRRVSREAEPKINRKGAQQS
jgi:hypothetical protein